MVNTNNLNSDKRRYHANMKTDTNQNNLPLLGTTLNNLRYNIEYNRSKRNPTKLGLRARYITEIHA